MAKNYRLSLGDIVRLKHPYRSQDWAARKSSSWRGFEFGIVAEFGDDEKVSLFLYDADGQLFLVPALSPQALVIPTYVEFDVTELVRYEIVTESGYSSLE
ncbi:hypothetical protein [Thermocoleostomius sinensis]|uniref:Uncharacterized protein n=1 Tax=Thermocoleostomius sinensis A174 TaxID=2016057 RepID=A0A9E9C2N5_9CYAN|nr:hypothetical protein [Thermocoleostomius sinensis]WAL58036.1 hypothetical protein OXH18_12595 [Thermocoleostomius sinensis A174]